MPKALGLDIGSVAIGHVIIIDEHKNIISSGYLPHKGNITAMLTSVLEDLDLSDISHVGFSHKSAEFFRTGTAINEQIAIVEGASLLYGKRPGGIFTIGGETFGFFLFDETGRYQKFISNSACAAGTGSFLDQQAERLGLADSSEIADLAAKYKGDPPKIATRCAVFAKTDLIHCQQQGFSISAISAGLCKGLAHNIADTLLGGITVREPVLAIGGVSKNSSVMHFLGQIIGQPLIIPAHSELAGAAGCALVAMNREAAGAFSVRDIIADTKHRKQYFFPPLLSEMTRFPDFSRNEKFISGGVEVDIYRDFSGQGNLPVYMGIDIGSTSTKLVLISEDEEFDPVLAGLYTRTQGQPVKAIQDLLRVLDEIGQEKAVRFEFLGVATTGSGRKFIQKVLNANLAIDEITAHARAAYQLDPRIDTIIEIGGQDAKFTVMKDGQVTFSVMNYVCAAGTGSFIEEQAKRLKVSLCDFSDFAEGTAAPLTSDRCTVFMERDLNNLLSKGYTTNELLAATLHSVRDNYLVKVAHLNKIGNVLCFQGATAKNRALVMAFEQKLQKPIFVSRYCHLTGALGAGLILREKNIKETGFRGIAFHRETPVIVEEICDECKNHCKLNTVQIGDDRVTWGYLCGKDETGKIKKSLVNADFDLLQNRRRIMRQAVAPALPDTTRKAAVGYSLPNIDIDFSGMVQDIGINLLDIRHKIIALTQSDEQPVPVRKGTPIGLPRGLYMTEYGPFWEKFLEKLGFRVVTQSAQYKCINQGKEISGAEFCAPISKWFGSLLGFKDKVEYILIPQMFAEEDKHYCYYSNYSAPLIKNNTHLQDAFTYITPSIDFSRPAIENVRSIYDALPPELKLRQTPGDLHEAFRDSRQWFLEMKQQLHQVFNDHLEQNIRYGVVLIGRPYIVLDPELSKGIPQKFAQLGIPTFYQDMLPLDSFEPGTTAQEFLEWNHWKYGQDIIRAAEYTAVTPGIYPVFLTAFKCSPDSFILKYFKEILDGQQKPFLVLQIDEHGSDVGYETRIESVAGAFKNHFENKRHSRSTKQQRSMRKMDHHQKTVLIPNYDIFSCGMIRSVFEREGYKAILIEESPTTLLSSLRLNDGQCLPVSAIVQGAVETMKRHDLVPQDTSIFLNAITRLACNFPQYPLMAKKILEEMGGSYQDVEIFATEFEMREFPMDVVVEVYNSYLLGGMLHWIGNRVRPYEIIPGTTDAIIHEGYEEICRAIASSGDKEAVFTQLIDRLREVKIVSGRGQRPKVSIIGDLYVRDNEVFNQQLVAELEANGAEVITTPYTYTLRLVAFRRKYEFRTEHRYWQFMKLGVLIEVLELFEKKIYRIAEPVLGESFPEFDEAVITRLEKYNMSTEHCGETAQNLLKIFSLLRHYPDLSLIIHVNPIFCCPGLVSDAIFKKIEKEINVPIVSITYDGTTTARNEILAPYLHYIGKESVPA